LRCVSKVCVCSLTGGDELSCFVCNRIHVLCTCGVTDIRIRKVWCVRCIGEGVVCTGVWERVWCTGVYERVRCIWLGVMCARKLPP
jgi:hypothetical protein